MNAHKLLLSCLLVLGTAVAHAESSEGAQASSKADAKESAQAKKLAEAQKKLQAKFEAADVDHDGKVTEGEAKAGLPKVAARFKEIDKGGKGFVTAEDIRTYVGDQVKLARSLAE